MVILLSVNPQANDSKEQGKMPAASFQLALAGRNVVIGKQTAFLEEAHSVQTADCRRATEMQIATWGI